MATKRSFSEKVTGSDAFAELSFEAQALYFQLSMAADDDGFVSTPKKVQKGIGASAAALDELKDAGYLIFDDNGTCVIAHWEQNNDEDDEDFKRREKNRERVRRFRERKKEEEESASEDACEENVTVCNADVTPCNVTVTLHTITRNSPSLLPLGSPSLPSPKPLSITPPIIPLISSPSPMSSSSSLYRARAQEFAVRYWGRKLRKYEKSEIYTLSEALARRRSPDAEVNEDDIELLEIAFEASSEAASPNVAYIRGVYANWSARNVCSPDDYWANEVDRDIESGKLYLPKTQSCS